MKNFKLQRENVGHYIFCTEYFYKYKKPIIKFNLSAKILEKIDFRFKNDLFLV